jgi:hypothetical protein
MAAGAVVPMPALPVASVVFPLLPVTHCAEASSA